MNIVIHQPHFIPWLGYFNKIANANCFVVLDNVQFRKNYFQNRTLVRNRQNKVCWLTVPVHHKLTSIINEVEVASKKWKKNLLSTIYQYYCSKENFSSIYEGIHNTIMSSNNNICSVNIALIEFILCKLRINVDVRIASNFQKKNSATETIVSICKDLGAAGYIFGEGGGLKYHGVNLFRANHIEIYEQNFRKKHMEQYKHFHFGQDNLSIIDYLFNFPLEVVEDIVKNTWVIEPLKSKASS